MVQYCFVGLLHVTSTHAMTLRQIMSCKLDPRHLYDRCLLYSKNVVTIEICLKIAQQS